MSASLWEMSLAPASGLLTTEQCSLMLDMDILNTEDDLLKTFPNASPKIEYNRFLLHDEQSATLYPPSPPEIKPNHADLTEGILQQLDNSCKQETIFSNWLEEKVDLPIYDNIPQRVEATPPVAVPQPCAYSNPQPTEDLLREFENVFGAVELTHLTPPQSPPGPATQLLLSYAQQAQGATIVPVAPLVAPLVAPQELWTNTVPLPETSPIDYEYDFNEVEELVRRRAAEHSCPEQLVSPNASPRSSPPSSPRSSSTDEEWSVPSRSKPYSRSVDDRRSRKKEQNKNAATRYRQKKKAEVEVLLNEEQDLRQHHNELSDKCSDLQREIRYIKGLMRDIFKAKGLIK